MKHEKASICLACLLCLAMPAFSDVRVDIDALVGNDFIGSPSIHQAAQALGNEDGFGGLQWEIVMGKVGVGGNLLASFYQDAESDWWLDWNVQAAYASYHFLGARRFFDPFVDAGIGCAGREILDAWKPGVDNLQLSVYPFASAGASFHLDGLNVGGKLSWVPGISAIPATDIPGYALGNFQAYLFAGVSIGPRRRP
jgi:hypothetical protein